MAPQRAGSSLFHVAFGHRDRLARLWGMGRRWHDGPGTMFHHCYECPALQTERVMQVSQEARLAARSLGPQCREQFAHGIFPSLPTGSFERACPVLWHNRLPDGLLEGHIFTDGSSSGSGGGRLRLGGWFGATCCQGRHPEMARTTQRPWQGHTTLDPLTLHIDCEGTIADRQWAKVQSLGRWGPEHTSGAGFSFPTTRSGQSRSRATPPIATWRLGALPTCSKGETTMPTSLQRRGRHTQACLSDLQDSCCLCLFGQASGAVGGRGPVQGLGRHQGCSAESTGYGRRERVASESGTRRLLRRLQVRFPTGFLPSFPHASHKTVISTPRTQRAQLAVGTSFRLWRSSVRPRHHLLRQMWSGALGNVRTRCAAAAAKFLAGEPRSCTN